MEGTNLARVEDGIWRTENDGSLRGESYEYVLTQPIERKNVGQALSSLQQKLSKSALEPSNRCGVHVHINVQSLTSSQLISFIVLYLCIENVLTKWCGEDRVGNLFCLRVVDAEYILDSVMEFMATGNIRIFQNDVRYGAMNLSSLNKYGSLEFRAMRTPADFGLVDTWVDMLLRVFDKSKEFPNAWDIPTALSVAGPEMFLEQTMGEYAQILADPDLDSMVMDGVRLAQAVAYAPFSPACQPNRKQRRAEARGELPQNPVPVPSGSRYKTRRSRHGVFDPVRQPVRFDANAFQQREREAQPEQPEAVDRVLRAAEEARLAEGFRRDAAQEIQRTAWMRAIRGERR